MEQLLYIIYQNIRRQLLIQNFSLLILFLSCSKIRKLFVPFPASSIFIAVFDPLRFEIEFLNQDGVQILIFFHVQMLFFLWRNENIFFLLGEIGKFKLDIYIGGCFQCLQCLCLLKIGKLGLQYYISPRFFSRYDNF